jgi:hypothetical protein
MLLILMEMGSATYVIQIYGHLVITGSITRVKDHIVPTFPIIAILLIIIHFGYWNESPFGITVINRNIETRTVVAQALDAGLPPWRPGFVPNSGHVGFVVDKGALGWFSPGTSVSPAKHSTDYSTVIFIQHHRPVLIQ